MLPKSIYGELQHVIGVKRSARLTMKAIVTEPVGAVARTQGMTQVARDSGLSRESLNKALSGERSPSFDTILKVVSALGLKLSASVRSEAEVA
ncbi:addiction module antidote protein [Synechococcus sp. BA-132 BA5]|uniref:addiction module antidote protein n=1 Tax=Synechococcus sp. BA-132 BA5 TaxID=3110252 RepID=UPI002B21F39E|nr:addiction module antidote protein [Synechococcus sp. BA-132 BA5]MEA5416606.1 addiction module antidote protein [Synechococcus sp. BA-132 BA5]